MAHRFTRRLSRIASRVFGDLRWQPPAWANSAVARLRAHRRAVFASVLLAAVLAAAGVWASHWWRNRPQPRFVLVTVVEPGITPLAREGETPRPERLTLRFSGSAARLDLVGKRVPPGGVRLEPPLPGTWEWEGDNRLCFTPEADWPADRAWRVTLDPAAVLAPHIYLREREFTAHTPPVRGRFTAREFYQDPRDPAVKQVTATLEFSHPVAVDEVERHLALRPVGESLRFGDGAGAAARPWTLTPGRHGRVFYLRTTALVLPEREDFLKLTLSPGVRTLLGGAATVAGDEEKVRVPDVYSFFQIEGAGTHLVNNPAGEPEQFLIVHTTAAARTADVGRALGVFHLPKTNPHRHDTAEEKTATPEREVDEAKEEDTDEAEDAGDKEDNAATDADAADDWAPGEVDADALALARPLAAESVPAAEEFSTAHTFRFRDESPGQLFVKIARGVRALGGFALRDDYAAVAAVPVPVPEVAIEGSGGVLALGGERRLSVRSRGVAAIRYEVARVPAAAINHLVSQSEGDFQNPEFPSRFDERDLACSTWETQTIRMENPVRANFSSFSFADHLRPASAAAGGAREGLFFLTASAWNPARNRAARGEATDRRFVLLTDLGLLVKANADGSRAVFVGSLGHGGPAGGVRVEILGRNGVPLAAADTDAEGRADLPSLGDPAKFPRDGREPVAITARRGDDVAFLPFRPRGRQLDFSRWDIGGVRRKTGAELDAFVFSERGVYRPGDRIHAAAVVKRRDWGQLPAGLPLEAETLDARGLAVGVQRLTVPEGGFLEWECPTAPESPTGPWTLQLYLTRGGDGKRGTLLGSTTVQVKEFLPDRLKIGAQLLPTVAKPGGWVRPEAMTGKVSLANLYGTPAENRRIKADLRLNPRGFRFKEFPEHTFYDRLREDGKDPESQTVALGERTTDATGDVEFPLDLKRFQGATYRLTLAAEGFEAEGGRSVTDETSVLVSPLSYVVGQRADGDLGYVPVRGERRVEFIAVDPTLQRIAVEGVTLSVIEQTFVSVLSKQANGNYHYESIRRETPVSNETVNIEASGLSYQVPTATPGNYVLELKDRDGERLSRVAFSVVGAGAVSRKLDKDAELEIKLSKDQVRAGDTIEISLTAPYAGRGLITIERERVYAHKWFQTSTTASTQTITVPADFDGTGYVNVAFLRAPDAPEVFTSPLSYGVVAFTANREKRRLNIELNAPEKTRPGEPLTITYKTDHPAKIVVYAVDQGILQVTNYKLPDPLAFLFRKSALTVKTTQLLDLVLPEFSVLRQNSAPGGDGDDGVLNPFRRVTDRPVVFWSGVLDADATARTVVYPVPDGFSGTLALMAVAVAPDAVGASRRDLLVRGPFTLTAGVPTVAAPGDRFEVGVTVANGVIGSGPEAAVTLTAEASEHLEIVRGPDGPLRVPEGRETTATFVVRVRPDRLGSARLGFRATANGEESAVHATLSVRPAMSRVTNVRGGRFTGNAAEVPVAGGALFGEFRRLEVTASTLPLGLAHGLQAYLQDYPNGCSEQITSAAFARVALADVADFGLTRAETVAQLERTFATLRRRQNDQGAFGLWTAGPSGRGDFVSVYVMHFLVEAKAAGFAVPEDLFARGLQHLQRTVAVATPDSLREARIIAYALYVLTREGVITTNYVLNLRDWLDRHERERWARDLTGVYLAGTLALLQKQDEAERLIGAYRLNAPDRRESWDFCQPLGADAQYVALVARHFPARLRGIGAEGLLGVFGPIGTGDFNTLSAAYATLALRALSERGSESPRQLALGEVAPDGRETPLPTQGGTTLRRGVFSAGAKALRVHVEGKDAAGLGAFYQVVESGYERGLADKAIAEGLEITRELLGADGKPTARVRVGEHVTVRLLVRGLAGRTVTNVAILDLLPGGFEVVGTTLAPGAGGPAGMDFVEVREDRAVFFGSVTPGVQEIRYELKAVNRGEFVVPPPAAESMYDRSVRARGLPGRITVVEAGR